MTDNEGFPVAFPLSVSQLDILVATLCDNTVVKNSLGEIGMLGVEIVETLPVKEASDPDTVRVLPKDLDGLWKEVHETRCELLSEYVGDME